MSWDQNIIFFFYQKRKKQSYTKKALKHKTVKKWTKKNQSLIPAVIIFYIHVCIEFKYQVSKLKKLHYATIYRLFFLILSFYLLLWI